MPVSADSLEVSAALFALDRTELNTNRRITSAEYVNRSDFVAGVHVELKSPQTGAFTLETLTDGDVPGGFVRCETTLREDYIRLAFSFSLEACSEGDIVDIVWIGRAHGADSPAVPVAIMACDGSKRGKAFASAPLEPVEIGGEWHEYHLLSQIQAPSNQNLFHVVFDLPANYTIDIADVAILKVGSRKHDGKSNRILKSLTGLTGAPARALVYKPLPDVDGVVEAVDSRALLSGWAWRAKDPLSSATVEIYVDGTLRGVASALPAASEQALSDNVPCRFTYQVPTDIFDGAKHAIEVRGSEEGGVLSGGARVVTFDNPSEGLVQINSTGQISGWAVDALLAPASIMVEILIDGSPVAQLLADQPHPVLSGARYNEGRCGFVLPLPDEYRDGAVHTLEARAIDRGAMLGLRQQFRLGGTRYAMHVDESVQGRLTGWIIDLDSPNKSVLLSLSVDGHPFGATRADRPVPAFDGRSCGFAVSVPSKAKSIELSAERHGTVAIFDVARDDGSIGLRAPVRQQRVVVSPIDPLLSEFFDPDWYLAFYPEVAEAIAAGKADSPLAHWTASGAAQGLNPSPWFDEGWYRNEYEDAAAEISDGQAASGFHHWLSVAIDGDWRRVGPVFDPNAHRNGRNGGPLDITRRWLASLHMAPAHAPAAAKPTAPTLRQIVERRRTARMFDFHVTRLIDEIGRADPDKASQLKKGLDQSETDALQLVLERPVADEPLVSIIMPTFNRGFLIAEAIQSILDQSWSNFELLICDDGSTDKTMLVVKEFADPRIRYLQLEKANGAVARNFGLKFATGKYIAFLDSDNIWSPFFLQIAIGRLLDSMSPIVYTGYIDTDAFGAYYSTAELKTSEFDYMALLNRNYIDLNTIVFDRTLYDSLGGFDEELGRVQDWDLMLRYCRLATPAAIPIFAVFYRRNIGWGQVTRLIAHTNFRQIVADRALDRLNTGRSSFALNGFNPVVTLIGGADLDFARELIPLAELLSGVSQVRLVLKDDAAMRRFAEAARISAASISWVSELSEAFGRAVGEAVILATDAPDPSSMAGDVPVLRLRRDGDTFRLTRANGRLDSEFTIGWLRSTEPAPASDEETPDDEAKTGSLLIVVSEDEALAWRRELWKRSAPVTAYLVAIGSDGGFSVRAFSGEERELKIDETGLTKLIGECSAVALLVNPDVNRELLVGMGVTAMSRETALFTIGEPTYLPWLLARFAHRAKDVAPSAVLKLISVILADEKNVRLLTRRGRRVFQYQHERSAMVDRLKLVLVTACSSNAESRA